MTGPRGRVSSGIGPILDGIPIRVAGAHQSTIAILPRFTIIVVALMTDASTCAARLGVRVIPRRAIGTIDIAVILAIFIASAIATTITTSTTQTITTTIATCIATSIASSIATTGREMPCWVLGALGRLLRLLCVQTGSHPFHTGKLKPLCPASNRSEGLTIFAILLLIYDGILRLTHHIIVAILLLIWW